MTTVIQHTNLDSLFSEQHLDENGFPHRDDGEPALILIDGSKLWYTHGVLGRVDGPSILLADGTQQYWIANTDVTEVVKYYCEKKNLVMEELKAEDLYVIWFETGMKVENEQVTFDDQMVGLK